MKAVNYGTACADYAKYMECDWGDLIEGTKEQLQAMGLGIACAFLGEVGGPRNELTVCDPRGYAVTITNRYCDEGVFTAHIYFPNWPDRPSSSLKWESTIGGLKQRQSHWLDEYMGTSQALDAAGLVRPDQLPGMPGMRKVRVTILPDGSLPTGASTAINREARFPGARCIERASASTYRVQVVVPLDEAKRRQESLKAADADWLQLIRAMPRPARLHPLMPQRRTLPVGWRVIINVARLSLS